MWRNAHFSDLVREPSHHYDSWDPLVSGAWLSKSTILCSYLTLPLMTYLYQLPEISVPTARSNLLIDWNGPSQCLKCMYVRMCLNRNLLLVWKLAVVGVWAEVENTLKNYLFTVELPFKETSMLYCIVNIFKVAIPISSLDTERKYLSSLDNERW